jgi:hypothetical protein
MPPTLTARRVDNEEGRQIAAGLNGESSQSKVPSPVMQQKGSEINDVEASDSEIQISAGGRCGVTGSKAVSIAVAFYGLFRPSANASLPTLEANLLAPLRSAGAVDVFVHALLTPLDRTRRGRENYLTAQDPHTFALFRPCVARTEDQARIDERLRRLPALKSVLESKRKKAEHNRTAGQGFDGSDEYDDETTYNIVRSRYSMGRGADLIRARENSTGIAYTHVVTARPDIAFVSKLRWAPLEDAISIPNFMMWGGVNDRFAYGPAALMLAGYMSQFDRQINGTGVDLSTMQNTWNASSGSIYNSETLLCTHLRSQQMRVALTPLCLARVRGAHGTLTTMDLKSAREQATCLGNELFIPGPDDFENPCEEKHTRGLLAVLGLSFVLLLAFFLKPKGS